MKPKLLCIVVLFVLFGAVLTNAATASTRFVCKFGCPYSTIQSAINAAGAGDTVYVLPGIYAENVVIDRSLTLRGTSPLLVTIRPAVSNPICSGGSLCVGDASNIILVQADNVTIASLTLNGDNPRLTSGVVRGGADLDARNGIITDHTLGIYNNLTVSNVVVKNIYLRGIYASSGGTFNFRNSFVTNVQGEYASIGIFNFGGSGVMANNYVAFANDAISSNHSSGVQFLRNKITHSGSGVHTDNAGDGGGTADLIKGNSVEDCLSDGYGIWVFVPYIAPTVQNNEVEGCSVGLAAFGQGAPVTTIFTNNEIDGKSALSSAPSNSIGVIVSTDQLGFGYNDVSAEFINNEIKHFNTGVYVEEHGELYQLGSGGGDATATFHNNIIHPNNTGANGMPDTTVNAENNWWGCAAGPNQPGCDTAVGTVDFTPWLVVKPSL
jgi:nitrous oxidase accessory protein NosD